MIRSGRWLPAAVALGLAVATGRASAADEPPEIRPGPDDRCPVCGMFVARHPDWLAGVRFVDGEHALFDGAKDLFRFLLGAERDGKGHTARDVRSAFVTDYYSLRQVDARGAWFVIGSDVLGPMGRELVPLGDERAAREFCRDHHGARVLRFADVTPALLEELG